MNKSFIILCCFLLLPSYAVAERKMTIEEDVIVSALVNMSMAESYDRICNNEQLKKRDIRDDVFAVYAGNKMFLVARIAQLHKARNPRATEDAFLERMLKGEQKIALKMDAEMKRIGCSSPAVVRYKYMYELFTTKQPGQIWEMLSQVIKLKGGTVTPVTKD